MNRWLALLAIAPLVAAAPAHAQLQALSVIDIADVARERTLDLRLSPETAPPRPAPLIRGMILHHDFAPNAVIGLGFANIYAKRRVGADLRASDRASRTKKPAVSFVFKF